MDLNILKNTPVKIPEQQNKEADSNDIAIIGIDAQIGHAKNAEEFWDSLCEGQDFIRDFPVERFEDADKIYRILHKEPLKEKIIPCAYMDQIDLFDIAPYHLSKTEAEYMSPVQKTFLESAWKAVEDGGYGGGKINNSNTGVYLGFSGSDNPFGEALAVSDPEAKGILVSGNVNSIIASRISYLLNLSGPSLLIDTACSSSLAALHIACGHLLGKEVDMAIVGGTRVMVLPRTKQHNMLGVESESSHARTFDETADGTGGGEGVICFLLKRSGEAIRDGDHIYAVVKGSAMNQDGASIGLTAPSADAQAAVIQSAWIRANVNPRDISYIEAHGTATKLGDPIEINGIHKAFSRYTDNRQFCAVGAVKTNVGHLDAAAGLTGLLKAVLMLRYKLIPPTIGFSVPNHEINFADSPVYVADSLREWDSEGKKRLCGVSSFGISGTNCHVILEEAPETEKETSEEVSGPYLLTISDETKEKLENRIIEYKKWLKKSPSVSFEDFCYTANYGKHVFDCRFYVCLNSMEEFIQAEYELFGLNANYGYHENRGVNTGKDKGSLFQNGQDGINRQVQDMVANTICEKTSDEYKRMLIEIGKKFIIGADIPWMSIYRKQLRRTLPIPIHSYNRVRCWPKFSNPEKTPQKTKTKLHPLIDELVVDSYLMRIYHTRFSIERCWELREHKINDFHVLVGTAFIEMAHFVAADYWKQGNLEFQNLVFYHALISRENEITDVQSIVKQEGEVLKIGFYSQTSGKWKCYMDVEARKSAGLKSLSVDIDQMKDRCSLIDIKNMQIKSKDHIVNINGIRWSNIEHVWKGKDEILIKFHINVSLRNEKNKYFLYPSLLDPAINSGNMLIDDIFLPYSCGHAEFYNQLPDTFYSSLQRLRNKDNEEFSLFDITFYSENGMVIGFLKDYAIKRVNHIQALLQDRKEDYKTIFHKVVWQKTGPLITLGSRCCELKTLLICRQDQINGKWVEMFHPDNVNITVKCLDFDFKSVMNHFCYGRIIYLTSMDMDYTIKPDKVKDFLDQTVKSLFFMVKELLHTRVREKIEIVILTNHYGKIYESDTYVNPFLRAFAGMGLCLDHEYDTMNIRVIDIGSEMDKSTILNEINHPLEQKIVALRKDGRYAEMICENDCIKEGGIILREGGVYLIAGGMGGMGLAFCRKLCSENKRIKIILMNRSCSESDIKKLWDQNYDIEAVRCDISDYNALSKVIGHIRERFGRIDGIINAAGIAGNGFIINKTWQEFADVLKPKVSGTINLHSLTKEDDLQFFVMCSSMSTLFGAPGQSDYTAANAFLDGFAEYRNLCGYPAHTIDWTGWSESGMAVENGVDTEDKFVRFVKDDEGAQLMYEALSLPDGRILAGEFHYDNLKKQVKNYKGIIMLSEELKLKQAKQNHEIDHLDECDIVDISQLIITGKPMQLLTQVEIHVISAWVKTLQIKEIDIYDKFLEVGGNSLLVAYLHKEIDKYYKGMLTITDLFLYSSISEIAGFINEKLNELTIAEKEDVPQDLDRLLDKLIAGEMEIEDVDEQINI